MVHLGYGPYPCSLLNSLEQTLSFCDMAEFITLPRCMKETVLRCILKGACEQLIPNILESVSNPPRDSLNEKIKRYELAPSGVAAHEVLTVSKIILAHTFHPKWESPNDLIDSLVETLGEIPIDAQLSTNQDKSLSRLKADLECHASSTLLLRQQEAASYPSLAILCIYFIRVLSLEFLGHEYMYGTQFSVAHNAKRGQSPHTDLCVVLIGSTIPRFLYKCKLKISPYIRFQQSKCILCLRWMDFSSDFEKKTRYKSQWYQ